MASSAWERRNAKARALGYKNYWDYRTHGYGAAAPTAPRPRGEEFARLQGRRSARGLEGLLDRDQVELVKFWPRPDSFEIVVTLSDGSEKTFRLNKRQMKDTDRLMRLRQLFRDRDVKGDFKYLDKLLRTEDKPQQQRRAA